jgi:signal transduction histidine kinase
MSHEIRTPLNAVLGIGRLLADTPLSLEQQQYVTMISNSGHLLLTIINDILDYSKIEVRHSCCSSTIGLSHGSMASDAQADL